MKSIVYGLHIDEQEISQMNFFRFMRKRWKPCNFNFSLTFSKLIKKPSDISGLYGNNYLKFLFIFLLVLRLDKEAREMKNNKR